MFHFIVFTFVFTFQFQAFCLYKANPGKRSPEEYDDLVMIEANQTVIMYSYF